MYVLTALPSVLASAVAGWIGNKMGRWQTVAAGLVIQGTFYAVGPKDILAVEIVSLVGLGVGMGLVDGVAPALLAQISDLRFGGTGAIYAVSTAATQSGFMFGPTLGGALYEATDFWTMSVVLGSVVCLYSLLVMRVFWNGIGPGDGRTEERERDGSLLGTGGGEREGGGGGGERVMRKGDCESVSLDEL